MKSLFQYYLESFRDIVLVLYSLAFFVLFMVLILEYKIAFQVDFLPGIDLPIDEWYEATFHNP